MLPCSFNYSSDHTLDTNKLISFFLNFAFSAHLSNRLRYTDFYLDRFITARKMNYEAVREMLKRHVHWVDDYAKKEYGMN